MTSHLYTNYKGKPVSTHSFSAGTIYTGCPRKYKLQKKDGWVERARKASMEFGKCLEDSIQYLHANEMRANSGPEEFARLWEKFKDDRELVFTDKEGDWESLASMGRQMLTLYEVKFKDFGILDPRFQLQYKKAPFAGDPNYGSLEFVGYVDMRCGLKVPDAPEPAQALIDIKTSASAFPSRPGILRLDDQLRTYSWLTGIEYCGFLVFVKSKSALKDGDDVTLLADTLMFPAGTNLVVVYVPDDGGSVVVAPREVYQNYKASTKGMRAGEKLNWVRLEYHTRMQAAKLEDLTKCRLQFIVDKIPAEDAREAGEEVGRQMVEICRANEGGCWPKRPSIRFPGGACMWCPMLGLCIGNQELVAERLINITPVSGIQTTAAASSNVPAEEDWFSEEMGDE